MEKGTFQQRPERGEKTSLVEIRKESWQKVLASTKALG